MVMYNRRCGYSSCLELADTSQRNPLYCAEHQRVEIPNVAPKPTLTEGTWDYLWPLVHLKVRGQYRTARWVFAELENSLRPGYAAANVFAILQHAATLGLVTCNSLNGEYVFMLTGKGWGKNAQVHPFTTEQAGEPGEPEVPQLPPLPTHSVTREPTWAMVHAVMCDFAGWRSAEEIYDRIRFVTTSSVAEVSRLMDLATNEGLAQHTPAGRGTGQSGVWRLSEMGVQWRPAPPVTVAHANDDLLATVLAKLDQAIAVNDSLKVKIDQIERLVAKPVKLSPEEFAESRKPFLREPDDPDRDRVQVPLDIDADLFARFEKYVKLWSVRGGDVNSVIVKLIEDFLP